MARELLYSLHCKWIILKRVLRDLNSGFSLFYTWCKFQCILVFTHNLGWDSWMHTRNWSHVTQLTKLHIIISKMIMWLCYSDTKYFFYSDCLQFKQSDATTRREEDLLRVYERISPAGTKWHPPHNLTDSSNVSPKLRSLCFQTQLPLNPKLSFLI